MIIDFTLQHHDLHALSLPLTSRLSCSSYCIDLTRELSIQGGGIFGNKSIRVTADRSYKQGEVSSRHIREFHFIFHSLRIAHRITHPGGVYILRFEELCRMP